jgi:hypothetical protein
MELIPYPKILVILMDECPDLEEIIDIFRVFNFMDTEAWIFPLEIEYGRINFSSQAEFSRAILKRKAVEIKKEEKDVISELSVSQEKSKSLDKNNIKKKRIIKEKEEHSSSDNDSDFKKNNNENKREVSLDNNIGYDIVKKRKLRSKKKEIHEIVNEDGQSCIQLSSDSDSSDEIVIPAEFRKNNNENIPKEKQLDPKVTKERNEIERKKKFDMYNDPNNNTNVRNHESPDFGFELLNLIPGNENDNKPKKRSFSEDKNNLSKKREKVKPVILHEEKIDKKNNSFMIKPFNSEEACEKEIEEKGSYNFKPKGKIFIEEEDDSPSEDDNFLNKPAVLQTILSTFTSSKTEMFNNNSNKLNLLPIFMILLLILILIIWRLFKQRLRLY